MKEIKYLLSFISPLLILLSFHFGGWYSYMGIAYGAVIIPLLDILLKPDKKNFSTIENKLINEDKMYDFILYVFVFVQYGLLFYGLYQVSRPQRELYEIIGMILTLGGACGNFGINIAHELGHRKNKYEKWGAQALLLTSLYLHFFIEHNYGHHKRVATQEDHSSARKGESLYAFFIRSIWNSYLSAWQIESKRLKRKKRRPLSIYNQMIWFSCTQMLFVLGVFFILGSIAGLSFIMAAIMGVLMLETINYIQHYGLSRQKINSYRYEPTTEVHSWDSYHIISKIALFNLGRHADHHKHPQKKYPTLQSNIVSPKMPTGYVGMMLMAQIPPLWFYIMHKRLDKYKKNLDRHILFSKHSNKRD